MFPAATAEIQHLPRGRGLQYPLEERRLPLQALGPSDEVAVGDAPVGIRFRVIHPPSLPPGLHLPAMHGVIVRHRLLPILLLGASLWAQSPLTAPRPIQREVLRIATRTGLFQPCLLLTESAAPRAVAILFPGGAGAVRLDKRSIETVLGPRGNFLIRSAEQFLSPELAVAILDCPSDRPTGMDDEFRISDAHASDARALLDALRSRFLDARFFLVGT